MRRPVAIALGAYALALALFVAFVAVPFVTKKREIPAEVPSPAPLRTIDLVNVGPGSRICMTNLAVSAESRVVRFKVGTYRRPGPPLGVTIKAGDYSGTSSVPAGYPDNADVQVPIPPPSSGRAAAVCVRNDGRHRVAFYAAGLDPAHSRVKVTIDGSPEYSTPTLSFGEAKRVSIAERAGVTAGRIAVFRGFLDHAWVVWLLAFGMLVGVPVLTGLGLVLSERQPRSDSSAE
jgi:hypothetical protein